MGCGGEGGYNIMQFYALYTLKNLIDITVCTGHMIKCTILMHIIKLFIGCSKICIALTLQVVI